MCNTGSNDVIIDNECLFVTKLDFWTEPKAVGLPVDIQIGPKDFSTIDAEFEERLLPYSVMHSDLQEYVTLITICKNINKMKSSEFIEFLFALVLLRRTSQKMNLRRARQISSRVTEPMMR